MFSVVLLNIFCSFGHLEAIALQGYLHNHFLLHVLVTNIELNLLFRLHFEFQKYDHSTF